MIQPVRIRSARRLVLALATLFLATLVASAAGSVSMRAATAGVRALQMAAGVLCAPGESGMPAHPGGHDRLGQCCCPGAAHPDVPFPPTAATDPADPAGIARGTAAVAASPGHPGGRRFIEARGPPFAC